MRALPAILPQRDHISLTGCNSAFECEVIGLSENPTAKILRCLSVSVRAVILCIAFFLAGFCPGTLALLWIYGGEPPWITSMPLFLQTVATALIAMIVFLLVLRARGAWGTAAEKWGLIVAALACAVSIGASLASDVWRGTWDWMSISGGALPMLYLLWRHFDEKLVPESQ